MKKVYILVGLTLSVVVVVLLAHFFVQSKHPQPVGEHIGEFTIVVLPDTQKYSRSYPDIFTAQAKWIVSQVKARNIVFVTHEGDVVDEYDSEVEWRRANASMSLLDGKVPYGILPGNHDKPTFMYNQYFSVSRYRDYSWYGGNYSGNNNNYEFFSGGGDDYVILHMEFCPPGDVIGWANQILKNNADRRGIIVTHGYLNENDERRVNGCDTQYIWDSLIAPNDNVFMVLSGHAHGESIREDTVNNRTVYQMLADYQDVGQGDDGWLRILTFVPSKDKIYVKTYSPYLNQYENDSNSQFTLNYSMTA